MITPPKSPTMLRADEAADMAGVGYQTIQKWAKKGLIRTAPESGRVDATPFRVLAGTLDISQVAMALGVQPDAVRNAAKAGHTKSVRTPTGRYKVTRAALTDLAWMRSDLLLTTEAARVAGVTTRTISGWVRDGVLPCLTTPRGQRRFVREEVEKVAAREADMLTPTQATNQFGVSARDLLALSMRAPILAKRPHVGMVHSSAMTPRACGDKAPGEYVPTAVTPDVELGGYIALDEDTGVASQGDTETEAREALAEAVEAYREETRR